MEYEVGKYRNNLFSSMKEQEDFCRRWRKVCEAYKYALANKEEYEEKLRQRNINHVLASSGKTFK